MAAMQAVSSIFDWIIFSSLMGSILVFLILGVKFAFKSALGANWHYYIWFLLLLRLFVPFTPESPVSMYNFVKIDSLESIISSHINSSTDTKKLSTETEDPPSKLASNTVPLDSNPEVKKHLVTKPMPKDSEVVNWEVILIIWLIGVVLLVGYTIFINLKFWCQIRTEPKANSASITHLIETCKSELKIKKDISVVSTNKAHAPALFGPVKPWLLIPDSFIKNLTDIELKYIVLHELAHWKRKDIIVNWITVVVQILHWFNPVIWYGFYRMHQDCEIACDAMVLSLLAPERHKEYGHTIIRLLEMMLTPQQWIPGTSRMLSQKSNIKRRIRMISKFKKESLPVSIITIIVFIAVGMVGCTSAPDTGALQSGNTDQGTHNQMQLEVENNQLMAGTVDVEGPGIVVTLSDGNSSTKHEPPFLIHDVDILNVINQLLAAEAEAISINDERLVASSSIYAEGTKVVINGNLYTSPFVIKSIGNSEKMLETLEAKGSPVEVLRHLGQEITIEKSESLSIPKYKGEVNFKYAKPVDSKNS